MTHALHHLHFTGSTPVTEQALDLFGREWTGYGRRIGEIFPAADSNPDCPLLQAYAAILHMALEAKSGFAQAQHYLDRAVLSAPRASAREGAIISAARHWHAGNIHAALSDFELAVDLAPFDLVAAKWGQYLAFNLGDSKTMLRLAERVLPQHRKTPEAWGMLAFAQEQTHDLAAAENSAHEALSLRMNEPWAQHALAHVYETKGDLDAGVKFLQSASAGWEDRSIFIREHNYWHLALFHLDRDEAHQALDIYDRKLWGEWPEFAQEQIGAISMLWRLKLRGADVASRLRPIAEKVLERGFEHLWPFHDLHYLFALAHSQHRAAAHEFLRSMTLSAQSRGTAWVEVARPAGAALVAHAEQDYAAAAELLAPLLPRLHLIGGSHAQRDIFIQTWLHAAMAANQFASIEPILEARQRARPRVATHQRDLAICRARLAA